MQKIKQPKEPEIVNFALTKEDVDNDVKIMIWDEGYMKYKEHSDYLQMIAIYVKKEYREQGTGTWFMEWLEEEAKMKNKNSVKVKAWTDGKSDILGRFLTKLHYKNIRDYIWQKKI